MNAAPMLLLCAGLAAGASVVTTLALRPDTPPMQAAGADSSELASLRQEIAALHGQLEALQSAESSADALPAARASERIAMSDIDGAVARYFEERAEAGSATLGEAAEEEGAAAAVVVDYEALLDEIFDGDLDEEGRQARWEQIRAAGKLDEAIAYLEQRAEEAANDPDAQVEVASAYIQKIFEVGDGPQAGLWAGKADGAYDRALALDPQHWDARFNKAISLSFWPPIFGKQGEAISHFETLIQQQNAGPVESHHAQTYVLLGNLYTQTGNNEKAQAIWNQGLALFPDDPSLAGKLAGGQ